MNFKVWMIVYAAKTISFLIIRETILPTFIYSVVFRTAFFIIFGAFILNFRAILDSWSCRRIKTVVYALYAVQYLIFYTETAFMDLLNTNAFASNLQSVEQFYAFVVFTELMI